MARIKCTLGFMIISNIFTKYLEMSSNLTRKQLFLQDGREVRLKDFVELLPNPGECETRPACVEALWSDGDDSQTFAYLSYFTRPRV